VRVEYRGVDLSCNAYLAISAMLAAGLDGIKRKIDPGDPLMKDVYKLSSKERRKYGVRELPTTLKDALECLESNELLRRVLGRHIYEAFIEIKSDEWNQYRLYITPWKYVRYLNI